MMFKRCGFWARACVVALSFWAAVFAVGCNGNVKLIDHVSFKSSPDLGSVRVSLVFVNNIQTSLSGSFEVGNYGFLFVNPFAPAEPFEVGFQLDMGILNDQDYAHFTPTDVLPNGLPIGVGVPLAQIQAPSPVSSKFDLFGYVDVLHGSWLGEAMIFNFNNDQYFPNGFSVSQVFMRDAAGYPGVIANIFGPTVDHAGTITRAGGIAVFANVRQLTTGHP